MEMTEIKRIKAGVAESGELSETLSIEAEKLLGYKAAQASERQQGENGPLAAALARLEIEILNPEDVHRYQMEMRHEAEKKHLARAIVAGGREIQRLGHWSFPRWEEQKIENYTLPIPEFVLNKACQIKREIPDVQIFIESLNEHPDPFLLVKHGKYDEEVYRVEVWDEPKFNAR